MKTIANATIGDLTSAITRAFNVWEKQGKPSTMPNWANIVRRRLANLGYEFHGPFGLRGAFSVNRVGRKKYVELEMSNHHGWTIGKRDYSKPETRFLPNTIGALNQLNYPRITFNSHTKLKDILP